MSRVGGEFLCPVGQANRLVNKFSIYWVWKETMCDACHINGTYGSKEVE